MVHTGHNWGLYTLLTEIPTYLNNVQHFSLKAVSIDSERPMFFCKFRVRLLFFEGEGVLFWDFDHQRYTSYQKLTDTHKSTKTQYNRHIGGTIG